ncbi:hypothetical protein AURDEDRAFT_117861 [Auricularia subglabra TFB-10046 SS5]|uniref:Uncharacterized protein n=1 Tax=Auricularia subglabra (strain TFB-10046 / SS5) TaxID=717982 RepID=J0WNT0_AURST|nr:hypothetical protein AURDEDRAFT_117861 [Auricularia subglabra TFB-10046 SS5]
MFPTMFEPIRDFAIALHKRLGLPDTELDVDPGAARYMRATYNPIVNREHYRDAALAMALFLNELQRRRCRACSGPGCTKCQRADWARGLPVPLREPGAEGMISHKELCPILARVVSNVPMDQTSIPQFAAGFRQLDLSREDRCLLRDWAVATRLLPPDITAAVAGLGERARNMTFEDYVRIGLANPR